MGIEEDLEKDIKELEAKLKDQKDSIPAHSIRPQQMLVIEELETDIQEKKKELEKLRKKNRHPQQIRKLK